MIYVVNNSLRFLTLLLCLCFSFSSLTSCKKAPAQDVNNNSQSIVEEAKAILNFAPTLRVMNNVGEQEGSIVFIEERGQPDFRLAKFDLATKDITTIFQILCLIQNLVRK